MRKEHVNNLGTFVPVKHCIEKTTRDKNKIKHDSWVFISINE